MARLGAGHKTDERGENLDDGGLVRSESRMMRSSA